MRDRSVVRYRSVPAALAGMLLTSIAAPSFAQPPPAKAPDAKAAPADAPSAADEAKKAEAKAHFDKGLALLQEGAWAAALAEFLISREMFPTRAATQNAGTCLRKLQRYDESLDMYEQLLREFPTMPPEARAEAQQAVAEMRELVGTIDIKGAEPGAAIVVSGQAKGEYPPISPLRVAAGTHVVRVLKEGFEPFEAKVDVAGGQAVAVTAKLRPLAASGRLRVVERNNRPLQVIVDGVAKGPAPWEGVLPIGKHAVWLSGKDRLGSAPGQVVVKLNETVALTLLGETLDANLRVIPEPALATVAIDGIPVGGSGEWHGSLKSGKHRVTVAMEGYTPESREVALSPGEVPRLVIKLDIDPSSPAWKKPARWVFDTDAGVVFFPSSLGGPAACTDCSTSLGVGAIGVLHGAYELGNGFGFGLSAGYLFASQRVTKRSEELLPFGFPDNQVDASKNGTNDDLSLHAFLGGLHASYHRGEKVPFLVRLGAGALVGRARDQRDGTFFLADGRTSYKVDPHLTRALAAYGYVDLALRMGVRIGDHAELAAGVQAILLLAIRQPTWEQVYDVYTGTRPGKPSSSLSDGYATYKPDATLGRLIAGVAPALSFRYDF